MKAIPGTGLQPGPARFTRFPSAIRRRRNVLCLRGPAERCRPARSGDAGSDPPVATDLNAPRHLLLASALDVLEPVYEWPLSVVAHPGPGSGTGAPQTLLLRRERRVNGRCVRGPALSAMPRKVRS